MKKLVNGELIDMTPQEIEERQAEEAAWEAGRADREWKEQIAKTDAKIPRYVEDIIDALDAPTKAKIAKQTLDAYNEKKTVRNSKK